MAPAAGSYAMAWRMLQEGVEWFGGTSNSSVTVSAPAQAPSISVTRTPTPMTAGQAYTLSWSSANATSVSRVCTSGGSGYTVSDAPALSGSSTGTASAAWVGYPSSCTWRATGAGGTATFNETMTTNAAPASEVVTYIHTDGLGSPVARSNASGVVISRTRYEPYGLTASGDTPTIGFTGHVNDADTGLVYMQQRYYDPVAGRFLSVDPVTTDAETGSSFNRYAYANNSPYRYIDPDGRDPYSACGQCNRNSGEGWVLLGEHISAVVNSDAFIKVTEPLMGGVGGGLKVGSVFLSWASRVESLVATGASGVKLDKAPASEAQVAKLVAGEGEVIAGAGSKKAFRDAPRAAAEHGGEAKDWSKVSGGGHIAKDGTKVETHALQKKVTNQMVELKTKLKEEGQK